MYDVIIIGAGLSGAVFADQFARRLGKKVLVVEKRDHIAGNCYDYYNEDQQLMNKYGLHLFHCNDDLTFEYITSFCKWIRYDHKVVARIPTIGLVPIPVNIETVNRVCGTHLSTTDEMNEWLVKHQVHTNDIKNGEDAAKARVGDQLYYTLFHDYTKKQWDKYPSELDRSVLERIPVRNNQDPRYFTDKYQVIPEKGYTHFVKNMLDHPLITIMLDTQYELICNEAWFQNREWLIYTGPIDTYFSNYPKLEYRSIHFEVTRIEQPGFYQKHVVINEPDASVPYTRTVEYKHLPYNNFTSTHTTIVREYTMAEGEPYYPVPNDLNKTLYERYKQLALEEEKKHNVIFVGRLANYKYKNMNEAIRDALLLFEERVIGNI